MFSNKFVKVLKTDLETLTTSVQDMQQEIETLKAEKKLLEENQSEFLMSVVKRQSDELKRLSHYQSQDETLYSYEQSNEKQKIEIAQLKGDLIESNSLTDNYKQAYTLESNMSDLLIERVVKTKESCTEYETVNLLDVIG